MKQRYAVHQVMASPSETLRQSIVLMERGRVVGLSPLTEETAHTLWLGGTVILSSKASLPEKVRLPLPLDELAHLLIDRSPTTFPCYAWHVSPEEVSSGQVRTLRRL